MVVEDFQTFWQFLFEAEKWYLTGFMWGVYIIFSLISLGLFGGYFVSAIHHGPRDAFGVVGRTICRVVPDLVFTSVRRTFAIAKLSIQESIRRRVLLVAFGLFAAVMLIGGWYLDVKSDHPERVYLRFVMTGVWLLILVLVWLLSSFSLPTDIKNKTIYTVTTKPVRASEVVLGRILGFTAIGTVLLLLTGVVSYFFVREGLDHSHAIAADDLVQTKEGEPEKDARGFPVLERDSEGRLVPKLEAHSHTHEGETSQDSHHRHTVTIQGDTMETDVVKGHWHEVTGNEDDGYELGPPEDMLQARVPLYGKMYFLDRFGNRKTKGINVGNEWTYRSYIEGGTFGAIVWEFKGIELEDFLGELTDEERAVVLMEDDERSQDQQALVDEANEHIVLPLELTLSVWRSHKGDIEKTVNGSIVLESPSKRVRARERAFASQEYTTQSLRIPRYIEAYDEEGRLFQADVFRDLAEDGELRIYIYCKDSAQYFGAAQADLYIRADDGSFAFNFFKGYVNIWFQMVVVISLGVMFSTFLNVVVTMLATLGSVILGFFTSDIRDIASGEVHGGGPIESLIRMVTQKNVLIELDMGIAGDIIQSIDWVLMKIMVAVTYMLPDLSQFDLTDYVIYGFNISLDRMAINCLISVSFFVILTVVGSFFLKTREIAA